MKFDCAKVSGKLDYVRTITPMKGGYKATISIDGSVIPNLQMTSQLYEELEIGDRVTLYGIFKNSNKKEKNDGILYGLQKENGVKAFSTQYRYLVPLLLAVTAAIAFCIVFVAGWFPSLFALIFFFGEDQNYMYNATVLAVVEGSLVALFLLWRAWVMFSLTSDPESWEVMAPATLSSRFSKFYK